MADVITFFFDVSAAYIEVLTQYAFTQALLVVSLLAVMVVIIKYVTRGGSK